jgi:hypothetical protein
MYCHSQSLFNPSRDIEVTRKDFDEEQNRQRNYESLILLNTVSNHFG